VVEPTHLKNMLVKMGSSSPIFGVNIKKYLKPTPSYIILDVTLQPGWSPMMDGYKGIFSPIFPSFQPLKWLCFKKPITKVPSWRSEKPRIHLATP